MTEYIILEINDWNHDLDAFYTEELPQLLGIKKDQKVNLSYWFKAQEVISKQNFYTRGMELLEKYKKLGYDVKMNMQNYKLSYDRYRKV